MENVRAVAAADLMKQSGGPNDLLRRLADDPAFAGIDLAATLAPENYVGRAPEQVDEFLHQVVAPIRARHASQLAGEADVRV